MNNEAYASQYIDHHVARHPRCGPVVMSRQNLAQGGAHPWVAHGCLEGAASFATDAMQLLGPHYRDAGGIDPGRELPGERLQHEVACPMVQSATVTLQPGGRAAWTFFGLYEPDHPEASSDADLARIDEVVLASGDFAAADVALGEPVRSVLQGAPPVVARPLDGCRDRGPLPGALARGARRRRGWSRSSRPTAPTTATSCCAHKERTVARRHGAILRTGQGMLPDETTLCATCWMHGVFAAQLTIGNTALPQALLGLARPLQHHPLERAPHPGRRGRGLAAARGAVGLRDRAQRLPLDLPARRPDRHGAGGRGRRRAGDAVARPGRGRAVPLPGVRPPGPRRARAGPRAAGSRSTPPRKRVRLPAGPGIRFGASATRRPSTTWSPARPARSTRSAATSCCTPTAGRAAAPTWRCGRGRRASWLSPSSAR